jgi:hypothetical protein
VVRRRLLKSNRKVSRRLLGGQGIEAENSMCVRTKVNRKLGDAQKAPIGKNEVTMR